MTRPPHWTLSPWGESKAYSRLEEGIHHGHPYPYHAPGCARLGSHRLLLPRRTHRLDFMSVHFEQELGELKQKLLAMAANAEAAVTRALRAFTERDDDLARRVKEDDS